ncbi:MAG TPA: MFS transporter [Actinomycetota bacterium]|nr:MFS transporter [Actinomycetota bacterium]
MVNDEGGSPEVVVEVPRPHPDPGRPPRLLAIRPLLWLVLAEGLANVAMWLFFVAAEGDAAFRFAASPAQFGVFMAAYSAAFLVTSPLAGMVADRWSPKRLLLLTAAGTLVPLAVAAVAPSIGWLYVSSTLYGAAQAVSWPAQGALIPLLVPGHRLVQANGVMGLAWQVPLVFGPALAAALVRTVGSDGPYVAAAAALVLALPLYAAIPDRRSERRPGERFLADLAGGFREAWRRPALRGVFVVAAAAYLLLGVAITLEAVYVREVLRRGQDFLGILWSLNGAGAVLGSLALARMRGGAGREPLLVAAGLAGGGIGYVLYVGTASPVVAAAGSFLFGAGFTFFSSPAEALIQRVAEQPGKVTSVYAMLGEGGPLGTALVIAAAGALVAVQPWLVWSAAAFAVLGGVALVVARRVRAPQAAART